jgi:hypothetical protein
MKITSLLCIIVFLIFGISILSVSGSRHEIAAQPTNPQTFVYHKLGIDVESPSNWPYKEDNASVTFYPREALLNNSIHPPVYVSIGFIPLPYHNLRIEDFASLVVNALNKSHNDFKLIENHSSTIGIGIRNEDSIRIIQLDPKQIANLLPSNSSAPISFSLHNRTEFMNVFRDPAQAYELVYTMNGSKTLIDYTKINNDFAYYTTYVSPISQYNHYLPAASKMLGSLTIAKSEFNSLMTCRFFKSNPEILNSIYNIIEPITTVVKLLGNTALLSC